MSAPILHSVPFGVSTLLFPIFALNMKLYAPGARTFLQVIHARFGKFPHITCCFAGILLNVLTTAMVMTGKKLPKSVYSNKIMRLQT